MVQKKLSNIEREFFTNQKGLKQTFSSWLNREGPSIAVNIDFIGGGGATNEVQNLKRFKAF